MGLNGKAIGRVTFCFNGSVFRISTQAPHAWFLDRARWKANRTERAAIPCVGLNKKRSNVMRSKTLVLVTAILLTSASLALGQGGSSGSSGSTGSSGTTGSAPGTAPGSAPGAQNSVPSGTGPTPAPTPGQSFTFPSNSGAPGTGSSDTRIPNGTGPTPAPTPGQSTSMPSGSSGATGSAQRSGCTSATAGLGTTSGGTPRIAEDPNVPRTGTSSGSC